MKLYVEKSTWSGWDSEYCGAKLVLDNENEHIYRHIDEAEIKRAETEQLIKLKELEISEKIREENKKTIKIMAIITLIGIFMGILCWIIASNSGDDEHWGYMITLFMMAGIPWMWIGKLMHDDNKKNK